MEKTSLIAKLVELGAKGYPSSAYFELTHRCNASCGYCYILRSSKAETTLKKAKEILDVLKDSGILHLHFTGGEPFLHPDFEKIFLHAIKCDFFSITILTNGTVLSPRHIQLISEHRDRVSGIQITVFSHLSEVNDRYFGVAGARDAMIASAKKLMASGIMVQLNLSVQLFNVDHIQQSIDFYEKLGFGVLLSHIKLFNRGSGLVNEEETTYEFFKRFFSGLSQKRLESFAAQLKNSLSLNKPKNLCNGRYCTLLVDPEGTVYPCVPFRNYPIGKLSECGSLSKFFSSDKMKRIFNLSVSDFPECACCNYFHFCSICVGSWHTRFGKFGVKDNQLCNFVKALEDVLAQKHIH